MARRPTYLRESDPVPSKIEKHMLELGFTRSSDYLDWCSANGFERSTDKCTSDMREEVQALQAIVVRRETHSKLHRKPKAFFKAGFEGDLKSEEIDRPIFKAIAAEIEASNEGPEVRGSLHEMLLHLLKFKDFVFQTLAGRTDVPLIRGLIKLNDRKTLWVRPLEDWKPKSKNHRRMFGELTHHLFDLYGDVPIFMEGVWLRDDRPSRRFRDWYVHLGRGYNLRTAKLTIPLTKKMAHHFMQAPDDFTVEQALRWGQMRALGCSHAEIHAVAASRLGRSLADDDFWFTVLRFIADNPMLDPRQIGPIVDYLQNQRFENVEIEIAPGEWRADPPPQPGLTMRGRTAATLLRQVDNWHRDLGRLRELPSGQYEKAAFDGFIQDQKRGQKNVRWVIRQLRSSKDLQIESDELRHCVASYHWSCAKGHCTIWNLSISQSDRKAERRQTIEVDRSGVIVQCRGLANRDPSAEEWSVVKTWARRENLQVASYL